MAKKRKQKLKADAVFEGGGVKGIGLVGAVSVIEKKYDFQNLVGTSAGAIVASLLAVGYTASEIKQELVKLDYNSFKDEGTLDAVPLLGMGLSIVLEYGIYEGKYFENWLESLLAAKGKTRFGDIVTDFPEEKYRYKLQVVAADITDRKLLVLPGDLSSFGYIPDQFKISVAVRMSMSIPVFFEPVRLKDLNGLTHVIVDGGVLSNYPIWLLDDGTSSPEWPTFGFKLMEPDRRELKKPDKEGIRDILGYLRALAGTLVDAHDNYHVSQSSGDLDRTIGISTLVKLGNREREIHSRDFDISRSESEALFKNGARSARKFLKGWDFVGWKRTYR